MGKHHDVHGLIRSENKHPCMSTAIAHEFETAAMHAPYQWETLLCTFSLHKPMLPATRPTKLPTLYFTDQYAELEAFSILLLICW